MTKRKFTVVKRSWILDDDKLFRFSGNQNYLYPMKETTIYNGKIQNKYFHQCNAIQLYCYDFMCNNSIL